MRKYFPAHIVFFYVLLSLASVFAGSTNSISPASTESPQKQLLTPQEMTCEYLVNPLGIDVARPRFTWRLIADGMERGEKQVGYQILVAGDPSQLAEGKATVWDSGMVKSSQSALVPYEGKALTSGEGCCWKVRVFDKNGIPSVWSPIAYFSMGLLNPEDWKGPWIKHPSTPIQKHIWFRKNFTLSARPVSASIHVASVGYHELYVNGVKVDERVLAPALTRLDKRVHYVTYDIARALRPGENCIALWTGAGWSRYAPFHVSPALRVQLNAKLTDGGIYFLSSDPSWRCEISNSEDIGAYKYRDHGGEQIDARNDRPNWNTVGFDDHSWVQALETSVEAKLSPQMVDPTRILKTVPAQNITGSGPYLVDLGENFSGWVELTMHNQLPGDAVTIQVSDNPTTVEAFGQKSVYLCKGGKSETFCNRFNYAAGRYITISGLKGKPELSDIKGLVVGTDLKRTGSFSCSNDLFNRIYETDLSTFRANTVEGYTSDCPHRERLGYGEENFATAWGCGLPNFDTGAFYTKLLRDWCDMQEPDGWISQTAPQTGKDLGGAMWSSAPLNIGWEFYKTYGDRRPLEQSYATCKSWLEFLNTQTNDCLLQPYRTNYNKGGNFLGDWAAPYKPDDPLKGKEFGNTKEAQFFNNCVYAMNLGTFIKIAKLLGRNDDDALYSQRLQDLRSNIQSRFFNPEQSCYLDSRQVHLAFPMLVGITPPEVRPKVLANFEKESLGNRPYLAMGSSGLPVLLKFLIEDIERNDILFQDLSKKTEPGYGYFLSQGETTWPEYWDDKCPSRIHTCYTGIAAWMIKGLAGIREDPGNLGYQSFVIKPSPVGDLTYAAASVKSLYGMIFSRWEKKNGKFSLNVTIPVNSSALVYVPAKSERLITEGNTLASESKGVSFQRMEEGNAVFRVESGTYHFVSR